MKPTKESCFSGMLDMLRGYRVTTKSVLLQVVLMVGLLQPGVGFAEQDDWLYIMSPGDNIWNISEKYLGDVGYVDKILRLNNIGNPDQLPPGTKVRIPLRWLKVETATVRVVVLIGDVRRQTAEAAEPEPLLVGALLHAGDRVIVGHDGNVVLKFVDGTTVFLGKDSTATLTRVNKLSNSGLADSQLDLTSGRTESKIETKGTRFEITTPSTSAVVRGTEFRLSVDRREGDISRVEVLGGMVDVGGGGENVTVATGFGTSVTAGETPLPPIRLLPAPEILSPAEFSRKLPVDFKWRALEGAEKYRLQVGTVGDVPTVLLDEIVENPRFSTAELQDGHYIVRVRAIDGTGLEGKERIYPLELDARPVAPFVVAPMADEVVRTEIPSFEWARPVNGESYHFQVSRKEDFSKLYVDRTGLKKVLFIPDGWEPGDYYWRVATRTDNETGPFCETQFFTVRPAPGAPMVSSESSEKSYSLRWPSGSEGQQYRVQVGADRDFDKVIVDEGLDTAQWQMERPNSLVYFRVRTVDVDGFEGAWSSIQKIDPPPPPWHKFGIVALVFLLIAL